MSKEKIGVGIITCNRPDYLKSLLDTLVPCKDTIDELVIINDGTPVQNFEMPFGEWIDNPKNSGVAVSKNNALKFLLNKNCDYLFLIEDDMLILDSNVFKKYIDAYKVSGIHHFNYGPGSPFNRKQTIQNFDLHNRHELSQDTEPNPRIIVDYKTSKIALYTHTVAMFSFFTKEVLKRVGGFPEVYNKCWEHVDHTYQIIKAGYHPPFWWFADIAESDKYVKEAPGAIENSAIAKNKEEWLNNVREGSEIYKSRHGHYPNQPPQYSKQETLNCLKQIKEKYSVL